MYQTSIKMILPAFMQLGNNITFLIIQISRQLRSIKNEAEWCYLPLYKFAHLLKITDKFTIFIAKTVNLHNSNWQYTWKQKTSVTSKQ